MPDVYKFNGSEGKPISLEMAREWIKNYQKKNPNSTKVHFFGRDIIERILGEDGCVGIRIYYASDEKGDGQLLLVGANSDGNNLLPKSEELTDNENIIADYSWPCPSYCPPEGGF